VSTLSAGRFLRDQLDTGTEPTVNIPRWTLLDD
jgi:hypothetical protein